MAQVLIAEVSSGGSPWKGQRDRSSENFSLGELPAGATELLWRTEPDTASIRFNVLSDVRANLDQRVLSNIAPGARTPIPRERGLSRRGFYIANPSGAKQDTFIVRVYALVPD
ncbi:hypothetical protein [Nocardia alni]|uniref:hypothetical protein n=1 Tax=Nocardia alni TaxID=2815723 RepID=UPI001C238EC7|nr:hypothetical protein [Nocardia alni]